MSLVDRLFAEYEQRKTIWDSKFVIVLGNIVARNP